MGFIHQEFAEAAQKYAGLPAVRGETGDSVAYSELDARSNALARLLAGRGVGRGERVGIMLPRTPDAIVAIFGTLKAGGAYVPIDPGWPVERVARILKDSALKALIVSELSPELAESAVGVVDIRSDEWAGLGGGDCTPVEARVEREDLAYILYTSGSTGTPKGVCISHRAAAYFANWARDRFGLGPADKIAALAPFTFDLSTFDIFSVLSSGAEMCLVGEKTKMLPPLLTRFMEQNGITVVYAVPTTLVLMLARGTLAKRDLGKLRLILFAGEVFPPAHLKNLMEALPRSVEWFNLFGPTETNVCLYHHVAHGSVGDQPVPIGQPLPGTRVVLAPRDELEEKGHELCIAGDGVMSGYWGRPYDAGLWVDDPGGPGQKAYRTGDIVEQGTDGNWLYFGRKDGMVKVWGYRVELGDVEAAVLEWPGIEQVVAVKCDTADGGGELAVFVVRKADAKAGGLDSKGILMLCKKRLPRYMVPRSVFELESVPMTHSGKIDRRFLAAQAQAKAHAGSAE